MGQLRGWRRWKMASKKVVCDVRERCEEMTSCLIKIKKQHNPNWKLSTVATAGQLLRVQMQTQVRMSFIELHAKGKIYWIWTICFFNTQRTQQTDSIHWIPTFTQTLLTWKILFFSSLRTGFSWGKSKYSVGSFFCWFSLWLVLSAVWSSSTCAVVAIFPFCKLIFCAPCENGQQ